MPPVTDMAEVIATLESLAKAATPGEWRINGPYKSEVSCGHYVVAKTFGQTAGRTTESEANAAYVEALNPATILKLCAEAGELREALRQIDMQANRPGRGRILAIRALCVAALKARNTRTQEVE